MDRSSHRTCFRVSGRRSIAVVTVIFCVVQAMGPYPRAASAAGAKAEPDAAIEDGMTVEELIDLVDSLKAGLAYDQVRSLLAAIIRDPAQPEAVVRRAYCELVFLDRPQDGDSAAAATAREALTKFPDLQPDPADFPRAVVGLCDSLRTEMFGAVVIAEPAGCRVFLDGEACGTAPVVIPYVPVGNVELRVTLAGFEDHVRTIRVEGGREWSQQITLDEKRGTRWWLTRIGMGAVAVAGTVLAVSGGDAGAEETVADLPGPPDPPR